MRELIATTKPHYHLMGGLHSGETGPSEMLMELVVSPRDGDVAAHHADPQQRHRLGHAGRRARRTRSQRRLVLSRARHAGKRRRRRHARRQRGAGGAVARRARRRHAADSCPYWGKYVYHDNNRDINLSQMSMRAITDWYFTAHPPIIHDLHEAQPLMYTYSGGPPQNPNLDPILFAELPFFSNWELSQMTKWGMPGVYTYAFMDGWSPGYLGSVAYNHNGMMRMYETQSGRRHPGRLDGRQHQCMRDDRGGRGGAGWASAADAADAFRPARAARQAARVVSRPPDSAERRRRHSRAATTRTTWRPACCRRCS